MLSRYFHQPVDRVAYAQMDFTTLIWALDPVDAVARASWKLPHGYEVTSSSVQEHTNKQFLEFARKSPQFMEYADSGYGSSQRLFTVNIRADLTIEFPLPQPAHGEPDQSYATASSEGGELLSSPPSDPMQASETD